MAENLKGTIIAAGVVPSTNADTYATHYEEYGQGGYRSVSTTNDRDSISDARKKIGMLVYVIEGQKMYRLDAIKGQGADNDIWTEVEAFNQKTVIASQSWWDNNKDNMPDSGKTTVYYVPEYNTDEVDYYVTTSNTGTELFETPYGIYTTDSEEGTPFNPPKYKTNVETEEVVYKIDYYKTYQYIDGNWVEGTTKGDTSYILSDDLNVVYSNNYSGYCKALVAAGLEVRDSGTTTDDMSNMKQAIDVLYAYLFPADYIDWTFTATPPAPSGDVWTYVNTDTVVTNATEDVIFKASNKQAQKSYKINKLEVNGSVLDTKNTATTEYTSAVTIPLYNAVAAVTESQFSYSGNASDATLTVNRTVDTDTTSTLDQKVHDFSCGGNFSVSGVLITQQEGKTESSQTLKPKSTFTLHALYQKPNDWNVSVESTASTPYLGHIYSAKTNVTVSANTLTPTVKYKDNNNIEHTVDRTPTNFFTNGTVTLEDKSQELTESSTVSKVETFAPKIVTAYTSIDYGTKVKVDRTIPYPSSSTTYDYTVSTDTVDVVGNSPADKSGNVNVAYNNFDYDNITPWTASNVDVKLVLAEGSAGVVNNTTVSGYVGQIISATCECIVSPNTKYDFSENDIDYQPTDAYKQDWTSVFTSDIDITFKKGQTTLTPTTAYIANKNSYADRNASASAKTDVLTFSENGVTRLDVTVSSKGQVTDVMSGCPQSYTVKPQVILTKKDWLFFVSSSDNLTAVPNGTQVSAITELVKVDDYKGYVAYTLPRTIDNKYIYVLTVSPITMTVDGLDMAYEGSPWQSKPEDAFKECNGGSSITLPANSFDKQVNAVNGYYMYQTQQTQSTISINGYLKISGK